MTFEDLLNTIKNGGDDNWDIFDAHIDPHLTDPACFAWAKSALLSGEENEHFRDAAATILARTEFDLPEHEKFALKSAMRREPDVFTRYWMASALMKRGYDRSPVKEVWEEACKSESPAGEFARTLKTA